MRIPSAAELLTVWERGAERSAVGQALLLLGAACPDKSSEALAAVTLGERNAALLDLRERMFGTMFHGVASCPGCRDVLELNFSGDDVRGAGTNRSIAELSGTMHSIRVQEYELQIRLPDSHDLEAIALLCSVSEARRALFERCVLSILHGGTSCAREEVPDEIVQLVEEQMDEIDPQGDFQLSLTCPRCGHRWAAGFDIASFLWSEIHACALRLLEDVHVLASAYGWREADILAMSSSRRQAYLEMVGQ
jgi:hypothetical protein